MRRNPRNIGRSIGRTLAAWLAAAAVAAAGWIGSAGAGEEMPPAVWRVLRIPENCDEAAFKELLARKDWLAVESQANLTDDWLAEIARFPELRRVQLGFPRQTPPRLTDAGLQALAGCPKLECLRVWNLHVPVTDETLAALARGCPELSELQINQRNQSAIAADGLRALGEAKNLGSLDLSIASGDDRALEIIARGCPKLERILLWGNWRAQRFGPDGLKALAAAPNIKAVQLIVKSEVGDDEVRAFIEAHPDMTELIFEGAKQVTDEGLKALAEAKHLQRVWLGTVPEAGDAGLIAFARNKPFLFQLLLAGLGDLTDDGLAALAELPQLRHLRLQDSPNLTDLGLKRLARSKSLGDIDLSGAAAVTDEGLLALAALPEVYSLTFESGDKITAAGIAAFKKLKPKANVRTPLDPDFHRHGADFRAAYAAGVKYANILVLPRDCDDAQFQKLLAARADWEAIKSEAVQMTDAWLEALAEAAPNLKSFANLGANPAGLTAEGMALLGRFPKLRTLELCSANTLTDDALAAIFENCPDLVSLHTCDSGDAVLTDDAFEPARNLRNLTSLTIRAVKNLTDQTLFTLAHQNAGFSELRIQGGQLDFTDHGFTALAACPGLSDLRLRVPAAGDAALAALGENNRALRALVLTGTEKITDTGLAHLAGLDLTFLHLPDARGATDAGLSALAGMTRLVGLELPGTVASDAGLARLDGCPALTAPAFFGPGSATDAGLAAFAKSHPNLRSLRLTAAALTDAALETLAKCSALHSLDLRGSTGLTVEGLERFRQSRPDVTLQAPRPSPAAPPPVETEYF